MTKEDFIKKYGDVEVEFCNYYKYTFTFKAELDDGSTLFVDMGGDAGEIYREEVTNDSYLVANLCIYAGRVYKDSVQIESFYD